MRRRDSSSHRDEMVRRKFRRAMRRSDLVVASTSDRRKYAAVWNIDPLTQIRVCVRKKPAAILFVGKKYPYAGRKRGA